MDLILLYGPGSIFDITLLVFPCPAYNHCHELHNLNGIAVKMVKLDFTITFLYVHRLVRFKSVMKNNFFNIKESHFSFNLLQVILKYGAEGSSNYCKLYHNLNL